jgi:phage tail sheath protein FI
VLAGTARRRGCWVAPANQPLSGVVALTPLIRAESLRPLQDARVNTVAQQPRGFLWMSADTLSTEPELGQITVRRLLGLLRRMALKYGPTALFEPAGEVLRRQIRRQFETLLAQLLVRGAFAGATPAESFQVAISSPPNTPRTADAGQLIVELKVAPSIPLRFLTVRLVNAGDGSLSIEGV